MAVKPDDPVALIDNYIEPNPYKADESEAWLRESGVSVWALIEYWYGVNFDTARVAHDYALPIEAVEAALAYYRAHKAAIDARLAADAS